MRIRIRLLPGLLAALGVLPALSGAADGTWYFHNVGTNYVDVYYYNPFSSMWGGATFGRLNPGDTGSQYNSLTNQLRWYWTPCNQGDAVLLTAGTYAISSASCGVANNHSCEYSISYQNTNSWGAHLQLYYVWSGGAVDYIGVGYAAPGATFTQNLTNYITAANWVGACPYVQVYDTAEPDESKQLKIDQAGTNREVGGGSSGSGAGSSTGGASGNPIGDLSGTNGLTSDDLRKLGQGLQLSLAGLQSAVLTRASELTLQGFTNASQLAWNQMLGKMGAMTNELAALLGTTNSLQRMTNQLNTLMGTTNYLSWLTNMSAMQTNLGMWNTNLLMSLTNQTAGLLTNTAGMGTNIAAMGTNIARMGTNIAAVGTNVGTIAGILEGWTNGVLAGLTNYLSGTNDSWSGYYSNLVSGASSNINALAGYGSGMAGAAESWRTFMNGTAPSDDWGVIKPKIFDGTQPAKYWIDMKKILRLDGLETAVTGLRGWVRNFILWGVIVGFIIWLMSLLREGVWHALTPPPMPSNALQVGAVGGALGPVGAIAGLGGAYIYKATFVLALFAGLMMLPSILIAVASTTLTAMGADPAYLAANTTAVSSGPSVFWKVVYLVSPWIPIGEIGVAVLNALVARFSVDGCVTFLMFYVKVSEK